MRRIVALATAGVVLVLLVIAQLVLPRVAEQRIRDRLASSGRVISVHVSAFPAIELLWHDADKVEVKMASYRSNSTHLGSLLGQSSGFGTLDASAQVLTTGLLTVRNAQLHKHGDTLVGTATVNENDLRASIPILQSVTPVASGDGTLILRGTGTFFGVTATVDAAVEAQRGKLVVSPNVPLLGQVFTLTLFSDPRVSIQRVAASPAPGGFTLTAIGRVH